MYFKGNYLRVITPVTTNGIVQKLDETGRAVYKETLLPLTARKHLETFNRSLERTGNAHLKHKIEVVNVDHTPAVAEAQQDEQTGRKPGRPKSVSND